MENKSSEPNIIIDPEQKRHLEDLHSKCRLSQWMNEKASYYYQKWSYAITIPSLVVNSLMAVLSTYSGTYSNVVLVNGIVFLLNAIVVGLKEFFRFDKRVQFHMQQSELYGKLANEIEVALISSQKSKQFQDLVNQYLGMMEHTESLIPEHITTQGHLHEPFLLRSLQTSSEQIV